MRTKAANVVLDNIPVTGAESLNQVTGAIASIFETPNEIDTSMQKRIMDQSDGYLDIIDQIGSTEDMIAALGGVLNIFSKVGEATANVLDVTSPNSTSTDLLKEQIGSSTEALDKVNLFLNHSLTHHLLTNILLLEKLLNGDKVIQLLNGDKVIQLLNRDKVIQLGSKITFVYGLFLLYNWSRIPRFPDSILLVSQIVACGLADYCTGYW